VPERVVDVYTDISIGTRNTGVGVVIDGLRPKRICHATSLGPGITPAEAETAAVLLAMREFNTLLADENIGEVHFFTDCETTVRAMFDLGRTRSPVLKKLIKAVLRETHAIKQRHGIAACLRFIASKNNPAHQLSREARREWNDLLSCKHED
jgi:hypothetical protein